MIKFPLENTLWNIVHNQIRSQIANQISSQILAPMLKQIIEQSGRNTFDSINAVRIESNGFLYFDDIRNQIQHRYELTEYDSETNN